MSRPHLFAAARHSKTILTAILLCFCVACGGKAEREAAHLDRGLKFFEAGDYEKARLELKTVRQINPKNTGALYHLGLIDKEEQNWQAAFIAFTQISEMAPDYAPAHLQLAELYFLSEEWDEANQSLDRAEAADPGNPSTAAMRGAIFLRQGNLAEAERLALQALATDPNHRTGVPLLVGLRVRQDRAEEAVEILDAAIAANPSSISLYQLRVALFREIGNTGEAILALEKLTTLEPTNPDHRTSLARMLIGIGKTDAAEEVLQSYIESQSNSDEAKLMLVDFLANQRGLTSAEEKIAEFSQSAENEALYLFVLSRLYEKFDQSEKAKSILNRIIALNTDQPTTLSAKASLAKLAFAENNVQEAAQLADEILAAETDNAEALTIRARTHMAQKNYDAAIIDLRIVLRGNPENTDALRLLGTAHARKGDITLAAETYDRLAQLKPADASVLVELASLQASLGAEDPALELLRQALKIEPKFLVALKLRAEIMLGRRNIAEVTELSNQIIEFYPDDPDGYRFAGQAAFIKGNTEEGLALMMRSYKMKTSGQTLSQLIAAHKARGGAPDAIDFLLGEVEAKRNLGEVHLRLAQLYFSDEKFDLAENAFDQAAAAKADWPKPYLMRAGLYLNARMNQEALLSAEKGLAAFPKLTDLRFIQAIALARNGERDKAIAVYETLLDGPQGHKAANNLANLLIKGDTGQPTDLPRALQLTEQFRGSSDPVLLDTLGWVQFKAGNAPDALVILNSAIQNRGDFPELFYHLGAVHGDLNNKSLAISHLKKALNHARPFDEANAARALLADLGGE